MRARLVGVWALLALCGCYEAIEHQAPIDAGTDAGVDAGTSCTSDDQCACAERCEPGTHVCRPNHPTPCVHSTDCTAPLTCKETHRAGHGCGSFECL